MKENKVRAELWEWTKRVLFIQFLGFVTVISVNLFLLFAHAPTFGAKDGVLLYGLTIIWLWLITGA